MKKILLLLLILACCSSTSLFASSIEHFRTQDGRHMCSIFMENEYSLCSTFGIIYDGDNVIQGEKPFFKAGGAFDNGELIPVGDEVFCVKKNEGDLGLKECKIQYVKLLDGSYLCFFPGRSDSRACDQVSFIDMSTGVPHTKNELIIEPASSGLWGEVTFVNGIQIDTKTTNGFIKLTSEEFLQVLTALEKNKSLNIDGQFPCDRPENVSKGSFGKNDLIISSHCEASGMVTLEILPNGMMGGGQIQTKEELFTYMNAKDKKMMSSGSGKMVEQTTNKNSLNSSGASLGECKVNGKPVDCEEMMQDVGGFLKAGLWIMLGFGALSLVGFVFWLVMLIHACSNDIPNKVLWIVLLFLFGIIAAIVYYFVVKRHCVTNYVPPINTQPYQASVTVGYHEGPVATTPVVAPFPPAPPTTPPVNPITPIVTTPVSTVPPAMPPSATTPTTTPTQTVESMIATSGAETMSQAPLGSSSSVTPTVSPDQNNIPLQNPPSTGV